MSVEGLGGPKWAELIEQLESLNATLLTMGEEIAQINGILQQMRKDQVTGLDR